MQKVHVISSGSDQDTNESVEEINSNMLLDGL